MTAHSSDRAPVRVLRVVTACGAVVLTWVFGSWLLHVNLGESTGSWAGSSASAPSGAGGQDELLPQRLSASERIRMLELRAHTIVSLRAR
jgi:hypothetical protein